MKISFISVVLFSIFVIGNASESKAKEFLDENIALHYLQQGKVLQCKDNDKNDVIVTNSSFRPLKFMDMIMFTNMKITFAARKCILYKK